MRRAFTLVELLVVVTIIIVLLSLLMPAMGRAIYQANLASCGAKLKLVSGGVISYALSNKQYYPYRGISKRNYQSDAAWTNPMALRIPNNNYDMRPMLRPLFPINQALQCPLSETIELDNTPPEWGLEASYSMFWGWEFKEAAKTHMGMHKLGDAIEWTEPVAGARTEAFHVLAGDVDLMYDDGDQASHPDRQPQRMAAIKAEGQLLFGSLGSVSRWLVRPNSSRGLIDSNYAFDDNSVRRYNDVSHSNAPENVRHDSMSKVPLQFDLRRYYGAYDTHQLPRN